ncbi:HEAT repeat domain-containing protein [Nostoc sp. DedQUE12b]|uniref:HEAT repeat domain-containing protein n=1 Tax=Nostoc sp. DedQUE12b TaxID=3075398 RepID=UPI003A0FDEE4
MELIGKPQQDDYTRRLAAESLGKIGSGNEKAIAALVELICKPHVDDYRTHLRSIQEGNRIWLNYELSYKFYRLIVRIFFLLFLSLNTTVL